ncbi:hypothetical protein Taro_018291 [Colocasia esculenta]|uniref:Uncharacterized protein n=1 Tax=Colocasia esculenta TaxID=4460 RepID=A0A843UVV3_COLES|nr:hypothetical protein [Colocasia esculenta]
MFLWRVLKDKRLKIRSFLADQSNVHRDNRQRIFNVQIPSRSLNTRLKTKKKALFRRYIILKESIANPSSEGRPDGFQGGCFPFRMKEDQLRLGVRIRKGDSTLDSEILRYCSGTGCRSPVERSSEPG